MADQSRQCFWQLLALIVTVRREQRHAMHLIEFVLEKCIDVRLVAQHQQLGFVTQQLVRQGAVGEVGGCQGKIGDDAIRGRQQMEFEAVDRLLLGGVVTRGGPA